MSFDIIPVMDNQIDTPEETASVDAIELEPTEEPIEEEPIEEIVSTETIEEIPENPVVEEVAPVEKEVAPIETVEETTVDNEPVVEVPVAEEITTNIVAETTYDKFNVNMKYTNDDVLEITFPKNIGFKNVIDMGMKIKKAFSYDVVVKGRTLTIVFNSSKSEEDCYEIFTNIYRVINPTLRTLK